MLGDVALVYALSPCHHSVKLLSECHHSVKLFFEHPSSTYDDHAPSFYLCLRNLPHVHTLQHVAREGTACGITNISFDELPVGFMEASSGDADMAHMVYSLQTATWLMKSICSSVSHVVSSRVSSIGLTGMRSLMIDPQIYCIYIGQMVSSLLESTGHVPVLTI